MKHLEILGGGVAGLAAAYATHKSGGGFDLYEASPRLGGNATTFRHGEFAFDSGAHRFHDVDPETTREIGQLLQGRWRRVSAPSRIYYKGRFVDFPLSPLNLARSLPWPMLARAVADVAIARGAPGESFEDHAVRAYGRTLAGAFLLNYSEKLWGVPASRLSPVASGRRLRGLNAKTFFVECLRGANVRTQHLDGSFYYPIGGIGEIAGAFARACPGESLHVNAPIAAIEHDGRRLRALRAGNRMSTIRGGVVSTIPITTLARALSPAPPADIAAAARSLRFRNVILAAIFVDAPSVSRYASTYFPTDEVCFTRVHEPKARGPELAPAGKTSLVCEIPCFDGDELWGLPDAIILELASDSLARVGMLERARAGCGESVGTVRRLPHAYPVVELAAERAAAAVRRWLSRFENLSLAGRPSSFGYSHIHDIVREGFGAAWRETHKYEEAAAAREAEGVLR
jgi:protoporphyrinogen oxidase